MRSRTAAWILISACTLATLPARAELVTDPSEIDQMIRENSLVTSRVLDDKHLWLELGARSDWELAGAGFQVGVGYLMKYFGFDARISSGVTEYKGISVSPGASQIGSANGASSDPTAQLGFPRNDSDPWNYLLFEPGMSISARLLANELPWLTERARVGLAWGIFNDVSNSIPFTAYLFTVEATLICQLGEHSPWSVSASLNWYSGALIANDSDDQALSYRRLPVSWIGNSIGLQYSF